MVQVPLLQIPLKNCSLKSQGWPPNRSEQKSGPLDEPLAPHRREQQVELGPAGLQVWPLIEQQPQVTGLRIWPGAQAGRRASGLHLPFRQRFLPFFFWPFPLSHRSHAPQGCSHLPDLADQTSSGSTAASSEIMPARRPPRARER